MEPVRAHRRLCDAQFVIGQRYTMEAAEERSGAQHRFYFACINDAWSNLSEEQTERFPTAEHLRKFALIKTGHADERTFVASSRAEALRIAAFMKPADEFCVVIAKETVVSVWTAKSQSVRAMGKDTFKKSCDDVLHFVAGLVGARPEDLGKAA